MRLLFLLHVAKLSDPSVPKICQL